MAVAISRRTGLPALPDHERWNIREQMTPVEPFYYPYPTGHLEIVLERAELVDSIVTVPGSGWRRGYKKTVVKSEWRQVPGTKPVTLQGDHPIAAVNAAFRLLKMRAQWVVRESLKGAYPPNEWVSS